MLPGMKRSKAVHVGALVAVAALVTACGLGEEVTADCVERVTQPDGAHRIVDDRYCDGGSHGAYVYVYGGDSAGRYVRGGTTVRPGDARITTRSGKVISRGGFGGRGGTGGG